MMATQHVNQNEIQILLTKAQNRKIQIKIEQKPKLKISPFQMKLSEVFILW